MFRIVKRVHCHHILIKLSHLLNIYRQDSRAVRIVDWNGPKLVALCWVAQKWPDFESNRKIFLSDSSESERGVKRCISKSSAVFGSWDNHNITQVVLRINVRRDSYVRQSWQFTSTVHQLSENFPLYAQTTLFLLDFLSKLFS